MPNDSTPLIQADDPGSQPSTKRSDDLVAAQIKVPDALDALDASDAPDASPPAPIPAAPGTKSGGVVPHKAHPIAESLSPHCGDCVIDQHGVPYVVMRDAGNPYVLRLNSPKVKNLIRRLLRARGEKPTEKKVEDFMEELRGQAEAQGVRIDAWTRVAPLPDGGIEIEVGDEAHTRIRITPGKVEILSSGSPVLFARSPVARAMALPGPQGDYRVLRRYINLDWPSFKVFIGWLTFTIAHPKVESTKYVILVLKGGQGSGKTFVSKAIIQLVDPSQLGVQVLPSQPRDLAIAAQSAHLLVFDNLREFSRAMSDALCIASTGGAITQRKLYSDDALQVLQLHAAMVLNGIHSFVEQPDLAQRCLTQHLRPISEGSRKSEAEMLRDFEADLPAIQRGLFDLVAAIFQHLPQAKVTAPTRMLDFSRWLAAMEGVLGMPPGTLQGLYAQAIDEGQLDSLLDNPLGAAMVEFAEDSLTRKWTGTPTELLAELNRMVPIATQRSRDWPSTPIALSKRLHTLQAPLATQGIELEFARGKHRTITIRKTEVAK